MKNVVYLTNVLCSLIVFIVLVDALSHSFSTFLIGVIYSSLCFYLGYEFAGWEFKKLIKEVTKRDEKKDS